jgi:hypothetical protein
MKLSLTLCSLLLGSVSAVQYETLVDLVLSSTWEFFGSL